MALKDRILANPVVATLVQMQKRTKADAADQFAAAIGFFGFVSIIPLIAIAVSVAALVLGDDPARVREIVASIQEAIPGLADSDGLESAIDGVIENGGAIGLVGAITLLIAGMRVTNAAQTATRFVFDLPLVDAKAWKLRAWQLLSLVVLGLLAVVSVGVTSYAATLATTTVGEQFGVGATIAGFLVGAALDVLLFWTAYRLYTVGGTFSWRDLVPGALLGGIGWTALKSFGTTYASSQASNVQSQTGGGGASAGAAAAGVIASVIGLLLLFYLAGRVYIYGAELSATLAGLPVNPRDAMIAAEREDATERAAADEAEDAEAEEGVRPSDDQARAPDDTGTLADRFRARGALVDDSVVVPTADGTGTEIVPWHAPAGSRLDDRQSRQVAAFTASALAVLAAGWLGRR